MPNLIEKTGSLLISGFEGTHVTAPVEELIRHRCLGGVILFERNFETPAQLAGLVSDLQTLAASRPGSLPLFISVDQEGGRVSRLGPPFTAFPPPGCLGRNPSEDRAYRFARALARELRSVGINMDYAPVLDVHTNPNNPIIGERAFSHDPDCAARLGGAFLRGFRDAGMIAVGKHFPGHGDTALDSHLDLPYVDRDAATLEAVELKPFAQAIRQGLEVLMTAHVVYRAWDTERPATFSRPILHDLLRGRLGYRGLVVSDDLEMKAVLDHLPFEDFPALGIEAGIDLFLLCHDVEKVCAFQDRLIRDVERGRVREAALDESLDRIRALKKRIPAPDPDPDRLTSLAQAHRALVRELDPSPHVSNPSHDPG